MEYKKIKQILLDRISEYSTSIDNNQYFEKVKAMSQEEIAQEIKRVRIEIDNKIGSTGSMPSEQSTK